MSMDSPEETLPLVEMADTDSAVMDVTMTDISIITHVRTKVEEIKNKIKKKKRIGHNVCTELQFKE